MAIRVGFRLIRFLLMCISLLEDITPKSRFDPTLSHPMPCRPRTGPRGSGGGGGDSLMGVFH